MKQTDIAKEVNVSKMFISDLIAGKKYTTKKEVAVVVGKDQGKPPIEYITPKLRETYLKAWPDLADVA